MKKPNSKIGAVALASITLFQTSHAALLFYEGFSDSDYTAGVINGQAFVGPGYASGGAWNTASDFVAGGLEYPGLVATTGLALSRDDGEVVASLDTTVGGTFGTAGVVGTDGFIGGAGVTGSLYFSVLARRDATDAAGFAGFQVYEGGSEGFGVGEVGNPTNHSWLRNGSNGVIGDGTPLLPGGNTNLFVFRLDFDADGTDAQVWINPDLSLNEASQAAGSTTGLIPNTVTTPSGGFNTLSMRGNRTYTFDEIRIGTTWESVTPVIPEPSSSLLSLVALSGLALRRSRRS